MINTKPDTMLDYQPRDFITLVVTCTSFAYHLSLSQLQQTSITLTTRSSPLTLRNILQVNYSKKMGLGFKLWVAPAE